LSISDEHLLLTSRITEEKRNKRNTRATTDFQPYPQMKSTETKEDIKSLKISAEGD